uniref:HEAT repeat-containing protein 5A n=1 Tax=Timema poppense TaxID=170557 RepID=A0A7R9CKB6_TIMPO|nr:unnamed protein product [Timema poppensis]
MTGNGIIMSVGTSIKTSTLYFKIRLLMDRCLKETQAYGLSDIKGCQKKLVEQLTQRIQESPGPPTRKLIARCLATLFSVGDTFLLFETVNKCNDILKNKDDSPSFLPTRLAAISCVGLMYEKLGRMMGRSYQETVQILVKSLRSAESQTRIEIMLTLEKVCSGMGSAVSNVHKEVYKAARPCLTDRVMAVRCAASKCLLEMLNHAPFLYTAELESLATLCFRAFDGSNYEVRCAVAKLLGALIACTQQPQKGNPAAAQNKGAKPISLEEALGVLMSGFLRGGVGFLKGTGEMIKGSSGVNREVRVGVTHAYVVFVQIMGGVWLERNLTTLLTHVLDLVANPKAASSHVDAVYSRKCINFILRSVLGRMLGEKAQASACKEITQIVAKQMASIDFNPENAKDCNQETLFSQHLLVCALQEMGSLILGLGTTAANLTTDQSLGLIEATLSVLVHPCQAARLAAAWCLRCICVAVPSQITPLIDRCVEGIENMRSSPEAIAGYSGALAAVLGGVRLSPLGVPHTKGKVTLEGRAGALSAMHSFLQNCPELITEDIIRRLLTPIESALAMLTKMLVAEFTLTENPANTTTSQLRAMCHADDSVILGSWLQETDHRTIEDQLQPNSAAGSGALEHDSCCLFRPVAPGEMIPGPLPLGVAVIDMSVVLFGQIFPRVANKHRLQMLDHFAECIRHAKSSRQEAVQMNVFTAVLSGLKGLTEAKATFGQEDVKKSAVALIIGALTSSNPILRCAAGESLGRMAQVVGDSRFTAELAQTSFDRLKSARDVASRTGHSLALGCLHRYVGSMGSSQHLNTSVSILLALAQDSTSPVVQSSVDTLSPVAPLCLSSHLSGLALHSACWNVPHPLVMRGGPSLVTVEGWLEHGFARYTINENKRPIGKVWSLHALALIADSGGPMFRGYVEPTLSLALKLLLNVPESYVDVHQCIGKVLSALITTVGPELQEYTSPLLQQKRVNHSTKIAFHFLLLKKESDDHQDPLVQAEATSCLQQLHLFAPRHVNLSSLVPTLCRTLSSNHLLLRKAAISCLRQLAQREAKEVCEHAMTLASESRDANTVEGLVITESGLPGVLFSMLDTETDSHLIKDIHDTLTSMLQMMAADNLSQWLALCKDVLTVATESSSGVEEVSTLSVVEDGEGEGEETEPDDDQAEFHAADDQSTHPAVQPRWPTRVFAAECVRKIIVACEGNKGAHFDLALAKEMQLTKSRGDYLVLHLSDLVRMAFMAATSDSDPLRLEGLKTLQEVIDKFARVPEPEFPGHLLLEQFQAQVGAALRPAFSPDTPSHVTAAACQVCSAWIGSGVARDLNDLRRVYIVAMAGNGSAPNFLTTMSRSAATPSSDNDEDFGDFEFRGESLLNLVQPELVSLSQHWLAALRDHALLSLPPVCDCDASDILNLTEFASQLPHEGGAFYTTDTMECSRPHYSASWPPILHAAALWLNASGFDKQPGPGPANVPPVPNNNATTGDSGTDRFHLLFGICMEALCSPRSSEPLESVLTCLQALYTLLDSDWPRTVLMSDTSLGIELCNVLHRLLLTRDSPAAQLLVMEVLKQVMKAAQDSLDVRKKKKLKEMVPANQESSAVQEVDLLGEGDRSGEITPSKSLVFAVLEVCLCLLVRQLPALNPAPVVTPTTRPSQLPSEGSGRLIASALSTMEGLPRLCSPQGAAAILPTVLYLTTNVMKECATKGVHDPTVLATSVPVTAALHTLRTLITDRYCKDDRVATEWRTLLQSALAKVIDLAKTGCEETRLDEVTMLLAVAVFVLHAPPEVVCAPNLQYPCINQFRQCLQSDNITVKLKCVQTVRTIFAHSDRNVATPYIHALAPRIIEFLYTDASRLPVSDAQLSLTLESIHTVETLITLAEPKHRIQMLTLLVPILVNCLLEDSAIRDADKSRRTLHEQCLQKLMKVGPQYPEEFKALMSQSSELRTKLEIAVRSSQQAQQQRARLESNANKPASSQGPIIKLKTDFSNFTAT